MMMPSRKRNKGRARKANNADIGSAKKDSSSGGGPKNNDVELMTKMFSSTKMMMVDDEKKECNHGCCQPVPSCCRKLLEKFPDLEKVNIETGVWPDPTKMVVGVVEAFDAICPEVLSDKNLLEMTKYFLISEGTDILAFRPPAETLVTLYRIASGVLMLENNGSSMNSHVIKHYEAHMKLMHGGERELIRFYSKRIPCSCLKELYARFRSVPKMAICSHCWEPKERSALRVCSQCKLFQYCSRECQVASWSTHKERCAFIAADREYFDRVCSSPNNNEA